jgi:hypothetical protein
MLNGHKKVGREKTEVKAKIAISQCWIPIAFYN